MKKPTHITVKHWFQKTYGNTYFSATVFFDDGSEELAIAYEYGYGDHGLAECLEWLGANGYATLPPRHSNGMKGYNTTIFLREVLNCSYEIVDVERKKDL